MLRLSSTSISNGVTPTGISPVTRFESKSMDTTLSTVECTVYKDPSNSLYASPSASVAIVTYSRCPYG